MGIADEEKYIDSQVASLLNLINENNPYAKVADSITKLDNYLFKRFCLKKYLEECEPFYCSHRINDSCEYIHSLNYFKNEKNICFTAGK